MKYYHVDVFSREPLAGNGLTVVFPDTPLSAGLMQAITAEFKQFETIFIFPEEDNCFPVRIFTVEEELDFAGHPMLGAAAVLHKLNHPGCSEAEIVLKAAGRRIVLESALTDSGCRVVMDQGQPDFIATYAPSEINAILGAMDMDTGSLAPGYPAEVVSTGLPYLLLPVTVGAIEGAGRFAEGFEELLKDIGAKFTYLFDPATLECRTWDNAGLVEDVATGSAAGPLCAYLVNNGYRKPGEDIILSQGRRAGRPSIITGRVDTTSGNVLIEGGVAFFAGGTIY